MRMKCLTFSIIFLVRFTTRHKNMAFPVTVILKQLYTIIAAISSIDNILLCSFSWKATDTAVIETLTSNVSFLLSNRSELLLDVSQTCRDVLRIAFL